MKPTAFSLLHPKIQQKLYQMKWTELRQIQCDAIYSIYNSTNHLVISANTASGKTEAAFLPIISQIIETDKTGLSAIYVGPLKALINDQFQRLENLCDLAGIPVFKWHGDVSSEKKKNFLKNPKGILLITPESIESIFINHSGNTSQVFSGLSFIVIDEMHSFIGVERGAHLRSLISRIMLLNPSPVRLIGLSATFGDTDLVKQWLFPQNPDTVEIIDDSGGTREVRYLLKGYLLDKNNSDSESKPQGSNNQYEIIINDLLKYFYSRSSLIFINSKQNLEIITDLVKRKLEQNRLPDFFMIHHGSLSKTEREYSESQLKSNSLTSCFTSSTLEMGIDVGNIERIGQIGPPWSVNSLIQRLGRSGRIEGSPSEMIMFIVERNSDDLIDRLFPDLLRAIAMSQLMLYDKWCEPPYSHYKYYSTFVQQIMSVIKEKGGINPNPLYKILVENGAFSLITKNEYISILRSMKEADLIEQTSEGLIILGLEGEEIVRSIDFYAVFQTPRDLNVINQGKKIGSIAHQPGLEEQKYLILAGRRWEIKNIDYKKNEILVIPSRAAKEPKFDPSSIPDIHLKIREKIKEILQSNEKIPYLDKNAEAMLQMARDTAKNANIFSKRYIIHGNCIYWFTWTGAAKNRTLAKLGKIYGNLNVEDCEIALKITGATIEDVIEFYSKILDDMPSLLNIAEQIGDLEHEKYDRYIPDNLLASAYSMRYLDSDIQDLCKQLVLED